MRFSAVSQGAVEARQTKLEQVTATRWDNRQMANRREETRKVVIDKILENIFEAARALFCLAEFALLVSRCGDPVRGPYRRL